MIGLIGKAKGKPKQRPTQSLLPNEHSYYGTLFLGVSTVRFLESNW
jgi:hypothetical protein